MPLGSMITGLLGSNKSPRAELNRWASPTAQAAGDLAAKTIRSINPAATAAQSLYDAGQGKQESLAGDQEGVLRNLMAKRMADDPTANLNSIFKVAFNQIDPNVVSPLARFDVNSALLNSRAHGNNAAVVDSSARRNEAARNASGRYYDVARQVYGVVPQLYNSAYAQGQANDMSAAGYIPQISQGYEAVSARPTTGIMNRIATANAGQELGHRGITNVIQATQGYKTPKNFADRLGGAIQQDEAAVMDMAKGAMSALGGMGGSEGGAGGGAPAYGSMYPGAGGNMYQSIRQPNGGGMSIPV